MITESVKIDKRIVDKVRKLKKKDSSINIGGFIGKAVSEKLQQLKSTNNENQSKASDTSR
jgi:hypothetical protein